MWAFDFQFDQTADGHILKLLHIVDEFTREALEIKCARSIDADATVSVLERLERLEHDPERLVDLWRRHLPYDELEQLAAFYGLGV